MGREVIGRNLRITGSVRWALCTKGRPLALLVCLEDVVHLSGTSLLGEVGASLLGSGSMKMEECYLYTFLLPERRALLGKEESNTHQP